MENCCKQQYSIQLRETDIAPILLQDLGQVILIYLSVVVID